MTVKDDSKHLHKVCGRPVYYNINRILALPVDDSIEVLVESEPKDLWCIQDYDLKNRILVALVDGTVRRDSVGVAETLERAEMFEKQRD